MEQILLNLVYFANFMQLGQINVENVNKMSFHNDWSL